ncbi:MAG: endonuclease/exonuclease/phosphatase family protein [Pirellulales bacterium]|nr:endonuclease/exonuclease/phosphatase family protein [Pirellulales bacterium]
MPQVRPTGNSRVARWALILAVLPLSQGTLAPAATASLSTMSFNVRYAADIDGLFGTNGWYNGQAPRKDRAVQVIRNFLPDVLGVQEPYVWQITDLQTGLPEYDFYGVGRNDGVEDGEYAGIFFRHERFTLLDSGSFWLSATPEVPGTSFLVGGVPRIASWVKLRDATTGQSYFILNTHWDNASSSARNQSAALIRDRIPGLAGELPVLVLGDFNTTQATTAYNEIRGLNAPAEFQLYDSYRDVFPTTGSQERTFHDFQGGTSGSRIDFILHSDDFTATSASIIRTSFNGKWPSDHYPVTATFDVVVVPEPGGLVLAAAGAVLVALFLRRR